MTGVLCPREWPAARALPPRAPREAHGHTGTRECSLQLWARHRPPQHGSVSGATVPAPRAGTTAATGEAGCGGHGRPCPPGQPAFLGGRRPGQPRAGDSACPGSAERRGGRALAHCVLRLRALPREQSRPSAPESPTRTPATVPEPPPTAACRGDVSVHV